jgi:hypothetical protein
LLFVLGSHFPPVTQILSNNLKNKLAKRRLRGVELPVEIVGVET